MAYPNEIVERYTKKYNLSDGTQNSLTRTLQIKGMQEILEKGHLQVEDLLMPNTKTRLEVEMEKWGVQLPKYCGAMSEGCANLIVDAYLAIKDKETFKNGTIKLTDLMIWKASPMGKFLSVMSESYARQIADNPACLEEIRNGMIQRSKKMVMFTPKKEFNIQDDVESILDIAHNISLK